MNKIKEKKLKAIKSEIEEIKNFAVSNNYLSVDEQNDQSNLISNSDDTLTLTKIIKQDDKNNNNKELYFIKKDLEALKSTVIRNENLLKEIYQKLDKFVM